MAKRQAGSAIRWDLLSHQESEDLRHIGVRMLPTGLEFSREPTWAQFTLAFAHVFSLKQRSPKRGTFVNFAVGACLNEGGRFFGKKQVRSFMRDFLRLHDLRSTILELAGGMVIALQVLEESIRLLCTSLPGQPITLQDLLGDDHSKRAQSLGHLARILKQTQVFSLQFEERLSGFVKQRNNFIHHLWIDESRKHTPSGPLPTVEESNKILSALSELAREVHYFDEVFQGFRYDILLATTGMPPHYATDLTPTTRWTKYIEEFRASLRGHTAPNDLNER